MTHQDAGHYKAKHPAGSRPDPLIASRLRADMPQGTISCARAHRLAAALERSPAAVGMAIDLLEGRIVRCQLGLFGYSPVKKLARAAAAVAPELEADIRQSLEEGRLSCAAAWRIADARGLPRLALAEACERLGLRIARCQLGAFG